MGLLNEAMTVKDLISHLKDYPMDYKVVFANPYDGGETLVPFISSQPLTIDENDDGTFDAVFDASVADNAVLVEFG